MNLLNTMVVMLLTNFDLLNIMQPLFLQKNANFHDKTQVKLKLAIGNAGKLKPKKNLKTKLKNLKKLKKLKIQ